MAIDFENIPTGGPGIDLGEYVAPSLPSGTDSASLFDDALTASNDWYASADAWMSTFDTYANWTTNLVYGEPDDFGLNFKQSLNDALFKNPSPQSPDGVLEREAKEDETGTIQGLIGAAKSAAGGIKDWYSDLDKTEKEFVWRGAVGLLSHIAQTGAQKNADRNSKANMMQAQTNRMQFQFDKDRYGKAISSTGDAWGKVTPMGSQYTPLPGTPVKTRFGG